MDWMISWLWDFLYSIQRSICSICDFIREIFYMLGGLETVNIDGNNSDLITYFVSGNTVKNIFLAVSLVGVITLVIFTLISIIRSEYAYGENKKGKGVILENAGKSFIIFLMIPFILLAGITLTNVTMKSLNYAMNPYITEEGGGTTIGGQMLVTSASNAYIGEEDKAQTEKSFISGILDYKDINTVKQYYDLKNIDFFVGIIGSIVILVMFAMCAITFIQRLFNIIMLYIISPISTSTIPLDDGARFKLWREMMVSKVLSGYGIILTMNLFFIIMPKLTAIEFFNDGFQNGIVRILFIIGGSFAVTKANLVISQLTGASAGAAESQQMLANMRTGMNITRGLTGTAIGGVGLLLGGAKFAHGKRYGGIISGLADTFKSDGGGGSVQNLKHDVATVKDDKGGVHSVSESSKHSGTGRRIALAPIKMAALPFKVLKDMASGGLVQTGKNFIPRLKNVIGASSGHVAKIDTAIGIPKIDGIENDLNVAEGENDNDADNT